MDDPDDGIAELSFLSASPNRAALLDALAQGPAAPAELEERLDIPHSTLQRNLSSLQEHGYVAYQSTENRYRVTTAGELARDAIDDAVSELTTAKKLSPFLDRFPIDPPFDEETLQACEVVQSTTESPYDPVAAVKKYVKQAGGICGFFPTVNPLYVEGMRKYEPGDFQIEAIAPPAAYEALETHHLDLLERITASASVDLYESKAVPKYALAFTADSLLLGAFDEHMRTHSVLQVPKETSLYEWGTDIYQEIKSTATGFGQ
jgi:predicted transcriptional regulator